MSRPLAWKWNENHIFVKNIPQYLARVTVPRLFEEFNPISEKNNFPDGKTTTMVFGFRNKDDARRAQEANHNRMLGDVVLHVELYRERKPVRYLRETAPQGGSRREMGFMDDNFEPGEWGGKPANEVSLAEYVYRGESIQGLTSPRLPDQGSQNSSWARKAGKAHTEPLSTAPDLLQGGERDTPTTIDDTPTITPHTTPVQMNLNLVTNNTADVEIKIITELVKEASSKPEVQIVPESEATTTFMMNLTPESKIAVDPHNTAVRHKSPTREVVEANRGKGKEIAQPESNDQNQNVVVAMEPTSSHYPRTYKEWDHADTTERIRWKHQCICLFCQMRKRRL